jgi:hypothetical protein
MASPTVRDILAEQHGGISRAGLLAWCRLRIDPTMTEEQLDGELRRLGEDLVDDAGFIRIRPSSGPLDPGPDAGRRSTDDALWAPPTGAARGPAPTSETSYVGVTGGTADEVRDQLWTSAEGAQGTSPTGARDADAGRPFAWVPPSLASDPVGGSDGPVAGWEAPRSGMSRSGRLLAILGAVLAASVVMGLLSALGSGSGGSLASGPPGGGTLAPGATMIGAYDLKVGDCVMEPHSEFNTIEWRPCSMPHEAEVFFTGDIAEPADGAFPGDNAFDAFTEDQCLPAFEEYTGSIYSTQSALDVSWFSPTEESWANGDRGIVCLIEPAAGGTTDRSWRGGNP